MINKNLVLVSQSPRRREIMSLLRIPFKTASPSCDETLNPKLSFEQQIQNIARDKALSVFDQYQDSILISADTVIVHKDEVLGKPYDDKEAFEMLSKLSGTTHRVITGVCILSSEHEESFVITNEVTFYPMSEEEIRAYVATKEPMGRSGSYSIQGGASLFVKNVNGDHFAIMGLPIGQVYQALKNSKW